MPYYPRVGDGDVDFLTVMLIVISYGHGGSDASWQIITGFDALQPASPEYSQLSCWLDFTLSYQKCWAHHNHAAHIQNMLQTSICCKHKHNSKTNCEIDKK